MILKYVCTIENGAKNYFQIEDAFKNALSEYEFIHEVDYDGEYLNLIIESEKTLDIHQKENEVLLQVNNTLMKLAKAV